MNPCGNDTVRMEVLVDWNTGISDIRYEDLFTVFPNPFHSELWIQWDQLKTEEWELGLLNVLGQRIIHQRIKPASGQQLLKINTAALADGLYFLIAEGGGKRYVLRVWKGN
jgi:hypothetical protein